MDITLLLTKQQLIDHGFNKELVETKTLDGKPAENMPVWFGEIDGELCEATCGANDEFDYVDCFVFGNVIQITRHTVHMTLDIWFGTFVITDQTTQWVKGTFEYVQEDPDPDGKPRETRAIELL